MGCGSCSYKQGEARRKRKEKNEKERKKRKKGKEKRERKNEKRKAVFRRSELVKPRRKVRIFNEGYAIRGRFPPTLVHFMPKGRVGA